MSASDQSSALLSSESDEEILPAPAKRVRITEGDDNAHDPRIGSEYQIEVGPWRNIGPPTPISGVAASCGELIWKPGQCDKEDGASCELFPPIFLISSVDEYLELVREMYGARDFSEEQALRALHFHNYNVQAALMQMFEHPLPAFHVEDCWTKEEKEIFEKIMRRGGKNFAAVAMAVPTQSHRSIMMMYYSRKNREAFRANNKRRHGSSRGGTYFLSHL